MGDFGTLGGFLGMPRVPNTLKNLFLHPLSIAGFSYLGFLGPFGGPSFWAVWSFVLEFVLRPELRFLAGLK